MGDRQIHRDCENGQKSFVISTLNKNDEFKASVGILGH